MFSKQNKAVCLVIYSCFFCSDYNPMNKTRIENNNQGGRMLQPLGWKEGSGLGHNQQGMMSPLEVKHLSFPSKTNYYNLLFGGSSHASLSGLWYALLHLQGKIKSG